jgi:hypothetical protein
MWFMNIDSVAPGPSHQSNLPNDTVLAAKPNSHDWADSEFFRVWLRLARLARGERMDEYAEQA